MVLRRLVEAGLVRQSQSQEDARRSVLTVTSRGREILERASYAPQQRLIAALRSLPTAERAQLQNSLERIIMGGQNQMPAFGGMLSPRKIQAMVGHVRKLGGGTGGAAQGAEGTDKVEPAPQKAY